MEVFKHYTKFDNWERPLPRNRAFYSPPLDEYLDQTSTLIKSDDLRRLYINTFSNTLDTTAYVFTRSGAPYTHIITGDIQAMWLRDSSAQVQHYLPLISKSPKLTTLFRGLIRSHAECILKDPYANAFYEIEKFGVHAKDLTHMLPGVHERKWELDSLIYPMDLALSYWAHTADTTPFDRTWRLSISLTVKTLLTQRRMHGHGAYYFDRVTDNPADTLSNSGIGPAYAPTGLIASSFRPSDDACKYPFNIPGNIYALHILKKILGLIEELEFFEPVNEIKQIIESLASGLEKHSTVEHPELGEVFAYEVDGLGNKLLLDDANAPSLLSLPFLGALEVSDVKYQATRKLILSSANENFFSGKFGKGVGSSHTSRNMLWPIALIMQAATATDKNEKLDCLRTLIDSSAGTGLLHESFNVDEIEDYTRPWFAWCNSLFGGLIAHIIHTDLELLDAI